MKAEDPRTLGKCTVTPKRILHIHRGLTPSDDHHLPGLLLKPLSDGGTEVTVPDVDTLLSGAYAEFGGEPKTVRPTRETLEQLELDFASDAP